MSAHAEYELHCDGEMVAGASGPKEQAMREVIHYLAQYTKDGDCIVYEVTRTPVLVKGMTS